MTPAKAAPSFSPDAWPNFNREYQVARCGDESSHGPHVVDHGPDQPRNCPGTGTWRECPRCAQLVLAVTADLLVRHRFGGQPCDMEPGPAPKPIGYCANCVERCEGQHGPCYDEIVGCVDEWEASR